MATRDEYLKLLKIIDEQMETVNEESYRIKDILLSPLYGSGEEADNFLAGGTDNEVIDIDDTLSDIGIAFQKARQAFNKYYNLMHDEGFDYEGGGDDN